MPRRGLDGTWDVSPVASVRLDSGERVVEVLLVRRAEVGVTETRWVPMNRIVRWPMNMPRPPPAWGAA